jgi:putative two-component system response regulator
VLTLAPSGSPDAYERALDLGASDYVIKPFVNGVVRRRVQNLLETRFAQQRVLQASQVLESRVAQRAWTLARANFMVVERLALAAECRDDSTYQHARRIGRTSGRIALALGASAVRAEMIAAAAVLHDVGKLAVSDDILLKPGKLTADEHALMQGHTRRGYEILNGSACQMLQLGAVIALTHHERWDGKGYPDGLAGDRTPMAGRVVALADVFDALTQERPYKPAWDVPKAVLEISHGSGTQFDPQVVRAFMTLDHHDLTTTVVGEARDWLVPPSVDGAAGQPKAA